MLVFIDDVIIFSNTADEHALRLENVLYRFDVVNLQLHPGKCVFAQPQVQYLGFILSGDGISASPDKVKAVRQYPTPKSVKDVRAYLGLPSFYRRLLPKFATITKPLTTLTRKDQQEAFEKLKSELCSPSVLAYPNFKLPFILTTDAYKVGIATILSQVQNGVERPIAYASMQLNTAEQAYTASEAEMLALVWATKHFRCYLYGTKFVARTDHSALTYLRNFADSHSRLMRWSSKLSELDFVVEYRPGTKIAHADALNRHVGTVMLNSCLDKAKILQGQKKDAFCMKQNPGSYSSKSEFFLDNDGAMYTRQQNANHQLVVPETLIQEIIRHNHDPIFVAHPGIQRTYNIVSLNYWWPGMRKSIENYVKKCDSCQKRKSARKFIAPVGEVEEPTFPFEVVSIDITGLYPTATRKNMYLLTFIDHFTKYTEAFLPCRTKQPKHVPEYTQRKSLLATTLTQN
jgi:hypothetical protein